MKVEMGFTFGHYARYLDALREAGYTPVSFQTAEETAAPKAIIRHDVDVSPRYAVHMAELDSEHGCASTFMVMLSSPFYNLLDRENERSLLRIAALGHEIGLHFDVTKYPDADDAGLEAAILRELDLLSAIAAAPVRSMSWHIPRKDLIGKRLDFLERRGIRNAYDPAFFTGYKYCSDSMMRWRDPLSDFLDCEKYPKLQVLTHPISYAEKERSFPDKLHGAYLERRAADAAYLEQVCPGMAAYLAERTGGAPAGKEEA